MHRVSSTFPLLFVLLLGLLTVGLAPAARAQDEAPPAAGENLELPEGVRFEVMGYATGDDFPLMGDIVLFRIRLDSDVTLSVNSDLVPASGLLVVDEGSVTISLDAPVTVLRAAGEGTPFPMETEVIEAGTEFTLEAGDSTVVPGDPTAELRNDGDEEAVLLLAVVDPRASSGGASPESTPDE